MLSNKNIVITGAQQGIGFETMKIAVSLGATVFACYLDEKDDFMLLAEKESNIIPIHLDLSDNNSIKNAVKEIRSHKKHISGLANIAGMTNDALFHMVTQGQLEQIFQINLFSQIVFSQYITKLMLQNDEPSSVVNISSISGLDGNIGQTAYSATKSAWVGVTKTMSKELSPKGIRVNAVAPGVIKTPMTDVLTDENIQSKIEKTALNRIGEADEVAKTICYLLSNNASYITGQIIRVDGGIG
ncbi:MAG: SDR family NAD(P)-dependent oxidoreductase [Clostridia bacterium]